MNSTQDWRKQENLWVCSSEEFASSTKKEASAPYYTQHKSQLLYILS
jgi:hypothetical protein